MRLVFGRPSSSNRICWSCLGDPRLNSRPITANAACSATLTEAPSSLDRSASTSRSVAIPTCSSPARTPIKGNSTSVSSLPRRARRGRRRGRREVEHGTCAHDLVDRVAVFVETVERQLGGFDRGTCAVGPKFAMQVAQRQIAEVEGSLAGQRQVGGERGVAAQAGEWPAVRGQREDRTLGVVHRLRLTRVGEPRRECAVVVLRELRRIDVGAGAVGGSQRETGHDSRAAPPTAGD